MAVLSEAVDGVRAPAAYEQLCVIVNGETTEIHRRIVTALAGQSLETSLLQVGEPSEPVELDDVDPSTIVVHVCDLDRAGEMAGLRRLRRVLQRCAIVVISPVATGTGVRRALDAGADAIVFEPELESTLAVAISAVASGQSVVPRKVRASVERPAFSHRERQVLTLVSRGMTNAQIAERLFLSESTIKSHLSSAFAKFGVRSRKEAATLFLEIEATTGGGRAGLEHILTEPIGRGETE